MFITFSNYITYYQDYIFQPVVLFRKKCNRKLTLNSYCLAFLNV